MLSRLKEPERLSVAPRSSREGAASRTNRACRAAGSGRLQEGRKHASPLVFLNLVGRGWKSEEKAPQSLAWGGSADQMTNYPRVRGFQSNPLGPHPHFIIRDTEATEDLSPPGREVEPVPGAFGLSPCPRGPRPGSSQTKLTSLPAHFSSQAPSLPWMGP